MDGKKETETIKGEEDIPDDLVLKECDSDYEGTDTFTLPDIRDEVVMKPLRVAVQDQPIR